MQATFEARIKDASVHPALDAIAGLLAHAERHLFVDRHVLGRPVNELKAEYRRRFGLTARQFNAIERDLRGKVSAARESAKLRVAALAAQVEAAEAKVAALEEALAAAGKPEARRALRFQLHQKRRRLHALRQRLAAARREAARPVPGICFGGRRLFRAQFHRRENGYASHEEWLADWRAARASQFFCLGSGDETGGNQTATLCPDGTLRLRVPPALEGELGRWVLIRGVRFPYGQDVIDRALAEGRAISFRFLRRERGWYVQAITERPDTGIVTDRRNGCLGVDLNPGLIAVGLVDRHGNPKHSWHFPVQIQGRRKEQVKAALAEAVADIVAWAKSERVPIAVERLDFAEKKARLEALGGKKYARMLSSFADKKFLALLLSRAAREGVEVILVNPAFTSVIGWAKFGAGYGLSPHAAAAVAIARRAFRFRHGERLRARSGSALPLPARNRGRHVWSDWGRLNRRLRERGGIARLPGRRPSEGGRGRGTPLSLAAHARRRAEPASGHGPPGDGLAPAPGCDPPAQNVGSAVRPA